MKSAGRILRNLVSWWGAHLSELLLLLCLALFLIYLRTLPYFNVLFPASAAILMWWFVAVSLFGIKSKGTAWCAALCFVIMGGSVILRRDDTAGVFGDVGFYAFLLAFIQSLFEKKS